MGWFTKKPVESPQAAPAVPTRGPAGGSDVLCVGAYERDNFGDLLFLEVTEALLPGARVTASSPLAADMSAEFGRAVRPYAHELRARPFDVVWSVGGELGRVNTSAALKYSLPADVWKLVQSLEAGPRRALVRQLTGMPGQNLVYVPDLQQFPLSSSARQVIHSAGLSGVATLSPEAQESIRARLLGASSITVRDAASQDVLREMGVDSVLSPDVVHALPLLFPGVLGERHDGICFHAAEGYLQRAGVERVSRMLVELATVAKTHVLLFVAGTATGHDSVAKYEQIVEHVGEIAPGVDVSISQSRDPMQLAREVAGARAWIGTSLHGRIIAASAGVPRISLSKAINRRDDAEKTARYARTWDENMPYSTPLDEIVSAYGTATDPATTGQDAGTAERLSTAALVQGRKVAQSVVG